MKAVAVHSRFISLRYGEGSSRRAGGRAVVSLGGRDWHRITVGIPVNTWSSVTVGDEMCSINRTGGHEIMNGPADFAESPVVLCGTSEDVLQCRAP